MANRGGVPQFGSWDNQNVGYTFYFEKVRENKDKAGTSVAPNEPPKRGSRSVDSSPMRPQKAAHDSSPIRPQKAGHEHRQANGGNVNSVFVPPPQQYGNANSVFAPPPQHYGTRTPPQAAHGPSRLQEHRPAAPSAMPQGPHGGKHHAGRASAIPAFGEWEKTGGNIGYTIAFDKVKQHKVEAKTALPEIPTPPPADRMNQNAREDGSLFSKVFACFLPRAKQ